MCAHNRPGTGDANRAYTQSALPEGSTGAKSGDWDCLVLYMLETLVVLWRRTCRAILWMMMVMITGVQSNLTKRPHCRRTWTVYFFRPVAPVCTPSITYGFWAHPSPQPKRHVDRFSRFCRAHNRDRPTGRQTDHANRSV